MIHTDGRKRVVIEQVTPVVDDGYDIADYISILEPWIERWYAVAVGIFLNAYFESVDGASFVPQSDEARE